MGLSKSNYEVVAKNNLVIAKALGTVVLLATMFNPPVEALLAVLVVLAAALSTVSTYAWMSR